MSTLDLHVVIHVRRIGDETITTIVGGPLDWNAAQFAWDRLDAAWRRSQSQTTRKVEAYYAVRSIHDPLVQPLLEQCSYHANAELAARAWGRDNGVKGNKGGWIYGLGQPVQGWFLASKKLERDRHIQLVEHPKTGKATWVNYGAPLRRSLKESRV